MHTAGIFHIVISWTFRKNKTSWLMLCISLWSYYQKPSFPLFSFSKGKRHRVQNMVFDVQELLPLICMRIRTTPQEDNSPPYRFWSWWVVLFRGSGPSGDLSWWGIVLGIVVLVGNGWALFLSGGELSSWGVVLEPFVWHTPPRPEWGIILQTREPDAMNTR